MPIASGVNLRIRGEDRTAEAFASVAKRSKKAMGGLKRAMAWAGAGIGVAAIARSAARGAQELGLLSDQAMRFGESAEYVQRLTGALGQVGIVGAEVETLAKAFQEMTEETGRQGAEGFRETLAEIAAMGDEQERVIRLGEVFGRRMGPRLAPLVRQGPQALIEGLDGVMDAFPAVSEASVNAGDSVADALAAAGAASKAAWLDALGSVIEGFENAFGMSAEEAIRKAVANFEWGFGVLTTILGVFIHNVGEVVRFFVSDWRGALQWVWDGFSGWLKAVWELFKSVFTGIKNVAVEFGKNFWSWIKGEGFDWGAVFDSAIDGARDASQKARDLLKASIPRGGERIEFASVDLEALRQARRDTMAEISRGIEAKAKLATGAATASAEVAEAGGRAAEKVRDAAREADAEFVSGSGYEALRLAARSRGAGGLAGGGAPAERAAVKSAETARNTAEMIRVLRDILVEARTGAGALGRLEAV